MWETGQQPPTFGNNGTKRWETWMSNYPDWWSPYTLLHAELWILTHNSLLLNNCLQTPARLVCLIPVYKYKLIISTSTGICQPFYIKIYSTWVRSCLPSESADRPFPQRSSHYWQTCGVETVTRDQFRPLDYSFIQNPCFSNWPASCLRILKKSRFFLNTCFKRGLPQGPVRFSMPSVLVQVSDVFCLWLVCSVAEPHCSYCPCLRLKAPSKWETEHSHPAAVGGPGQQR